MILFGNTTYPYYNGSVISKWNFVGRKELLDHPRMKIVEDTVVLPDGKQTPYIREMPGSQHSVAIIAVNDKNELLLQKEYSYPPDEVMYQLPGGSANDSETIIESANRELSEESGYVGRSCQILGFFYLNNRRSDRKQYVVLCKDLVLEKQQEDEEEFIENMWVSLGEVDQLIKNNDITNIGLLAALRLFDTKRQDTET